MADDRQPALAQTVEVETPELVVFSYTVAGLGSRVAAGAIDLLLTFLLMIAVSIVVDLLVSNAGDGAMAAALERLGAWAMAVFVLLTFVIFWGYHVLFEGLADGQTPGKRILRLRVVRDGGYSVGFAASAVRNLLRVIDMQPIFFYLVGIAGIAFSRAGKRLGDVVAGTVVVREGLVKAPSAPRRRTAAAHAAAALREGRAFSATLTDDEFRLLGRWLERRADLDPLRRDELTKRLADRLAHALPDDDAPVPAKLIRLFEAEERARKHGIAAKAEVGAGRERYAIVATQAPRWIVFASLLSRVQSDGLASLGERGVREFVADYRSLASDYARLRTASRGASSEDLFYLGRLLSSAHNVIYRDRRFDLIDVVRFFTHDIPREIRRSYAPILLAAMLFFGPAIVAHTAIVRHPRVAAQLLPQGMLDRAENGIRRAREGDGYIEDPQLLRPVLASQIIANNIQVTFLVFAAGVTLGIGTTLILLMNGVSIGAVVGLYVSKGIGGLLMAFVAPHGVLELSAICIAGGGGFLLAAAILLPGNRTRRRALAENSMRAIRLIGGSTLLLIAAGAIEGLISPIPYWPLSLKLIVSAMTAVLLYLYLRSGVERRVEIQVEEPESGAHLGLSPATTIA